MVVFLWCFRWWVVFLVVVVLPGAGVDSAGGATAGVGVGAGGAAKAAVEIARQRVAKKAVLRTWDSPCLDRRSSSFRGV